MLAALPRLKLLFLEADIGDSRLRSLRLGADVMVKMPVMAQSNSVTDVPAGMLSRPRAS